MSKFTLSVDAYYNRYTSYERGYCTIRKDIFSQEMR